MKRNRRDSLLEFYFKDLSFSLNFYLHVVRKSVNNRSAYAVQTTGNAVCSAAEFSACVKNRMNDFNRRDSELGMDTDRNTGSVICNSYGTVFIEHDIDRVAAASECLVDRISNYLINEVVKTP